jgi:hypothetical protein
MVHRLATELGYGEAKPADGRPHTADQSENPSTDTLNVVQEPAAVP